MVTSFETYTVQTLQRHRNTQTYNIRLLYTATKVVGNYMQTTEVDGISRWENAYARITFPLVWTSSNLHVSPLSSEIYSVHLHYRSYVIPLLSYCE